MMWYNAWREKLKGVRLVMSQVEHLGGEKGLMVGISLHSSSGSTMEREWVG